MTDSLTTPVPDAFSVSAIVEFVETQENRWEDGHWRVAGVVAGGEGEGGTRSRELHAAAQGRQYLYSGLQMRLHPDDAESYYYNLVSDNPGVFVICNQESGGPLRPFIATLSYGEATSYMETDVIVETVAMPPELYRWAERFVLEHYVPEKRKKRKRDNWKEIAVAGDNKSRQDAADNREDFLERWSRRKLDAGRDDQGVSSDEADIAINAGPANEEPETVLTDADMPPIETLNGDSDYSPFLSPGVSDDLRHRAMRKLFGQPEFNITDGLNDYDEDYTQFTGLGNVITHEMKRMLQRELEKERNLSTADTEPSAETQSHEAVVDSKENDDSVETEPVDGPEDPDTTGSL